LEETVLKTSVDWKPGESDLPDSQKWHDQMMHGDCQEIMREMPSGFVDLIITSPPYADSRKNTYGGIHPD
jgi:hypothetical protein